MDSNFDTLDDIPNDVASNSSSSNAVMNDLMNNASSSIFSEDGCEDECDDQLIYDLFDPFKAEQGKHADMNKSGTSHGSEASDGSDYEGEETWQDGGVSSVFRKEKTDACKRASMVIRDSTKRDDKDDLVHRPPDHWARVNLDQSHLNAFIPHEASFAHELERKYNVALKSHRKVSDSIFLVGERNQVHLATEVLRDFAANVDADAAQTLQSRAVENLNSEPAADREHHENTSRRVLTVRGAQPQEASIWEFLASRLLLADVFECINSGCTFGEHD